VENTIRLKTKIDQHEFDAEGPIDTVNQMFADFKELVKEYTAQPQKSPVATPVPATIPNEFNDVPIGVTELSKIMKIDGRVVSLTVRPKSIEDAVLLLIYGQRVLQEKELTTGGELIDGLLATGGLMVGRIDRLLEKIGRDGDVIVAGARRSKRYRLTNSGLLKVRQLASEYLATVA
jgi:hypothetical protein